ncbi:enoyl-CoA hydratase/carnithine racemase [Litoreibacter ponti]|uniref:Enoyl-CoA hydratase/carnithine racemase n=1 Tax=Litoreibacter ponti TaxID=1510457 RepID=A0A2T6BNW4_9RHOB|nr:enoyl-CoA hydratase/isomerase family protein [Litoreibacter ponti]PTX57742.1 enoyl-CoA hydratase/carnithine racemase [Litoreibacter ponti]
MIEVSREDALWIIKINRPEKANSLTRRMLRDLALTVEDAAGKAQTIILTGEGKVFSAGADLEAAKQGLAVDPIWERLSRAIANFPGLSIAALNGTVAGGAMGMVLACDLRVSVPGANFFYPVMKLGFLPQPSDPGRLAALVGVSRAKMILMAGEKIDAMQAEEWGLVDRLSDDPLKAARSLAEAAMAADPRHVAGIKALLD